MSILNAAAKWLPYIKDIDIKSNEWPWDDETWETANKYIVRSYIEDIFSPDSSIIIRTEIRGFFVCKIIPNAVLILKLAVHPNAKNRGVGTALLMDVIRIAQRRKLKMVCVTIHEENTSGIKWISEKGFKGAEIVRATYPDGRDGYTFYKEMTL